VVLTQYCQFEIATMHRHQSSPSKALSEIRNQGHCLLPKQNLILPFVVCGNGISVFHS
jgi:hypothetical protein